MKKSKSTAWVAIFVLSLFLVCLFTACKDATAGGEDTTAEITYSLNDFVYDTDIDTDHVITDREFAAMNRLWISEFGKKFAETPEEAMKREEGGTFYFGRYGRTFVFYRKQFNMEMTFSWSGHNFVMPWGEFYFINGENVYNREEIVLTSIFTNAHLKAFYDCYRNTYLNYKATITLPEGEHVLTQEELDSINLAYAKMQDAKETYKVYETLEVAMQRKKDRAYYFGKFGDTVIIWSTQHYNEKKSFTLGGYDFDFYSGGVIFYDPTGVYRPEDEGIENIMTEAEIKAFYEHYVGCYIPLNTDPYVSPELSVSLDDPSEEEMRQINEAYGAWKYDQVYNYYYEMYIESKSTPAEADKYAVRAVGNKIGTDPHRFFNEENFRYYQYWGKSGEKIFLATQNNYQALTVLEIAGYKFVLDGSGCDLIVCDNGKITPLDEAYEKGAVTKAEVAFAHERYLVYMESLLSGKEETPAPARLKIGEPYKESPIVLSKELQREIVWEYIAGTREEELEYSYAVRCYGKFGEVYAVMIDGPFMYTQAERRESVAGYKFIFHTGQRMYIYKEGDFYTLNKAYELGIVNEENIASIEWSKIAPYTYTKTTSPVELTEEEIESILRDYTEFGASHKKDAVYSIRCYGKPKWGYVAFIDCNDKTYDKAGTVEKVGEYEFVYPTEQTLLYISSGSSNLTLTKAYEYEVIDAETLKSIYETYRAAHPELYK